MTLENIKQNKFNKEQENQKITTIINMFKYLNTDGKEGIRYLNK